MIYYAKDGTQFDDPIKCAEYERTIGVIPGTTGQLKQALEPYKDYYVIGLLVVWHNEHAYYHSFVTYNIESELDEYTDIEELPEEDGSPAGDHPRHGALEGGPLPKEGEEHQGPEGGAEARPGEGHHLEDGTGGVVGQRRRQDRHGHYRAPGDPQALLLPDAPAEGALEEVLRYAIYISNARIRCHNRIVLTSYFFLLTS